MLIIKARSAPPCFDRSGIEARQSMLPTDPNFGVDKIVAPKIFQTILPNCGTGDGGSYRCDAFPTSHGLQCADHFSSVTASFQSFWHIEVDNWENGLVGIGRYLQADENATIVAAALDRDRGLRRVGEGCGRLVPAGRRNAQLKPRRARVARGFVGLLARIGETLDKLVVRFRAQPIGDEHDHAPYQLGALFDRGPAFAAKHMELKGCTMDTHHPERECLAKVPRWPPAKGGKRKFVLYVTSEPAGRDLTFVLRAGMMASRRLPPGHVIPAQTDHMEDKAG